MAEREGFEPDSGTQSDQQATESESNSIPTDTHKSPQLSPKLSLEIPLFEI
jgi:hypothetical protein